MRSNKFLLWFDNCLPKQFTEVPLFFELSRRIIVFTILVWIRKSIKPCLCDEFSQSVILSAFSLVIFEVRLQNSVENMFINETIFLLLRFNLAYWKQRVQQVISILLYLDWYQFIRIWLMLHHVQWRALIFLNQKTAKTT